MKYKSIILQLVFLIIFCVLNSTFIDSREKSFGLAEGNIVSLSEQKYGNDFGIESPLLSNTINASECMRGGAKEARFSQRTAYAKKDVKYVFLNSLLPVSSSSYFNASNNVVPRSCETNNVALRVYII